MACNRPGFEDNPVVVRNTGGTVYLGVMTGPRHQVTHRPSMPDQLLPHRLGQMSVTIMLRTTLFPHDRSRLMGTTPAPQVWYHRLAESFSTSLATMQWQLPSLAECKATYYAEAPSPQPQPAGSMMEAGPVGPKVAKPKAKPEVPKFVETKAKAEPKAEPKAKRAKH